MPNFNPLTLLPLPFLLVASLAQAQNLVVNGSFETGPEPGREVLLPPGSSDLPAWTIGMDGVHYVGEYWTAADGVRNIDLNGLARGSLTQSLSTQMGATYRLAFSLGGNTLGPPQVKRVRVSAGSVSRDYSFDISGCGPDDMHWREESLVFTAQGPISQISFASLVDGFYGAAIDDVRVASVACAPCDANCDGSVSLFDIQAFAELLQGGQSPCSGCAGDTNSDGSINQFDIQRFIECL